VLELFSVFPDGKRIGYVSWQEEVGKPPPPELYTVSADGTDNRRINRTLAVPPQGDVGGAGSAQWSPTGDRIAYLATERDPGRADLYVASAEGTDHVRLNGTLQTISRVRWSPSGDRIAYVGQIPPNGFIRLYTSATSGEEDSPVQVSTGVTEEPIWSPDGTHLAYLLSGEYKLAVNRGTGGDERIVSRDGEKVSGVTWSEDGSRLVYVVVDLETERRELRSVRADGSDNVQIWDGIDQYSLFP